MPTSPSAWLVLITLLLFAALMGMLTASIWALGRLLARQPIFPVLQKAPQRVPWGVGSVLLVILLWIVVNIGVSVTYMTWSGARVAKRIPSLAEQMAGVSLINSALLIIIPGTLRLTTGAALTDLGLRRQELAKQLWAGTLGFLILTPPVYVIYALAARIWHPSQHPLQRMVLDHPTAGIACLAVLSAVLLAPAAEELVFRGIIQSWLTQWTLRSLPDEPAPAMERDGLEDQAIDVIPALAPVPQTQNRSFGSAQLPIVVTSALFAAVHADQWPAPVPIFFLAVGLGLAYQRTGSLVASFVMHALFNGFSTLILFQAVLVGHPANPKIAPTATCSTSSAPSHPGSMPRVVQTADGGL
jgi:membrane protease YdiL (CAAX protease family)